MEEQVARVSGVLAEDEVRLSKGLNSAFAKIPKVANRCSDKIEHKI